MTAAAVDPSSQAERKAQRLAWLEQTATVCRGALARGRSKRSWIRIEIRGACEAGRSVEVYPGVRGWLMGMGRTARIEDGRLVQDQITSVKVCARTLLAAIERDQAVLAGDADGGGAAP